MLEQFDIISVVSALGVIVTIIITFFNNNKQNKLSIITTERVKKYNLIEEKAQAFLGNARCAILCNDNEHREAVIKSSYDMKMLFHYGFSHDKVIIDIINQIVDMILEEYVLEEKALSAIEVLASVIDVYLSAEWARIKTETTKDNREGQYANWCKEYDNCRKYNMTNHNESPAQYSDNNEFIPQIKMKIHN